VAALLTHMAVERRLSESSQNQALCAIVFLYGQVLNDELGPDHLGDIRALRSTRPKRLPTVLSVHEIQRLIAHLPAYERLIVRLLYRTGLRISECCTLRVRDLDFDRGLILVVQGKGKKYRVVMLRGDLEDHLQTRRELHERDLSRLAGYVPLPDSIANKVDQDGRAWMWQYVFASTVIRYGPGPDGRQRGMRWHVTPSHLGQSIKSAARAAGIVKRVTPHTFRHSFATYLLEARYDIRQVQTLLGHADVSTTMIYTHVMNKPQIGVMSPLDRLSPRGESPVCVSQPTPNSFG
jgi:integron integrase